MQVPLYTLCSNFATVLSGLFVHKSRRIDTDCRLNQNNEVENSGPALEQTTFPVIHPALFVVQLPVDECRISAPFQGTYNTSESV